jgi:predicted TIM-barrel fold metal-dependent hydrolase
MSGETILEPDLPIIDPHHHLWDIAFPAPEPGVAPPPAHPFFQVVARRQKYLLPELLADLQSGHNVRATVFVQCHSFHKADGPAHLRPVGETEFVNGVAAMAASGVYGGIRACAGIVGHADCTIGDAVKEVLEAHLAAGGGRFRGIRHSAAHDADGGVLGPLAGAPAGLYVSDAFRTGYRHLADYGLSFDAWLLEPQLPDLIDLARRFPDIPVILNHAGTPLGLASYQGRREERFPIWQAHIQELARLPHVSVKLGGLGMAMCNFPSFLSKPPTPSVRLAAEWAPYLETCIEAFGPERCMFESNFPVDLGCADYDVLWNAFKVFAMNYSADEKAALFGGTAAKVYRLAFLD